MVEKCQICCPLGVARIRRTASPPCLFFSWTSQQLGPVLARPVCFESVLLFLGPRPRHGDQPCLHEAPQRVWPPPVSFLGPSRGGDGGHPPGVQLGRPVHPEDPQRSGRACL